MRFKLEELRRPLLAKEPSVWLHNGVSASAGTSDFPIRIHAAVLRRMIEHARREAPMECCGFLSGTEGRIERIHPMENRSKSPKEFSVAPRALLDFFRQQREASTDFLGIYHSHPTAPAKPSAKDISDFHYPGVSYWILSLAQATPDIGCYRWGKMGFETCAFQILKTPIGYPTDE